jgi:hypothetical protein
VPVAVLAGANAVGEGGLTGARVQRLDELLLHGSAMLEQVGADMGLGFGVGGGVGLRPTVSAARRSVMAPERSRRAKAIS